MSEDDLLALDHFRNSFGNAYESVVRILVKDLGLDVTGRPAKSTTSIVDKLRRESIRLTQMQDVAGCRILVEDIVGQDALVPRIHSALISLSPKPPLVIDRRKRPSHGYRAVHVVAEVAGRRVEIQVRTRLQHLWAELSEKLADRFGASIKYGNGEPTVLTALTAISGRMALLEKRETELESLSQQITSTQTVHYDARLAELRLQIESRKQKLVELLAGLSDIMLEVQARQEKHDLPD